MINRVIIILRPILKLVNRLTKKKKGHIYVISHPNYKTDCYDIINYSGSNLLTYLNHIIQTNKTSLYKRIYVEVFDFNRISLYEEYLKKFNLPLNLFIFIPSHSSTNWPYSLLLYFKNTLIRFTCQQIWEEYGGLTFPYKVKNQKVICFNYFIPYKNDYEKDSIVSWEEVDTIISTCLLPAYITSCTHKIPLHHFQLTGFPRNDNLISKTAKEKANNFLIKNIGRIPSKIIVYAPTYRDYDFNQASTVKRNILGYEENGKLGKILSENDAVIIAKFHPRQDKDVFVKSNDIIFYNSSFEYTLYDLLSVADILISDYSSVCYDFMLLKKQIIFNFYDYGKYESTRGFSYDPIDFFSPGIIAYNETELYQAIENALKHPSIHEKNILLLPVFHKFDDFCSSSRIDDILK